MVTPHLSSSSSTLPSAATGPVSASVELPWKARVEEPTNRFLYYRLAKPVVKLLVRTPITANQVTLVQPLIAAFAGYLIAIAADDWRFLVAGALLFEFRSLLDCVDGSLARAKNTQSDNGHALDGLCDWLSVVCLYVGVYFHFRNFAPPAGAWQAYLPMGGVILLSLLQGGVRSYTSDYYMRKYGSVIATGRDETVEVLRTKQLALTSSSPLIERAEAWIGRCQHLSVQHELFNPDTCVVMTRQQADHVAAQRNTFPMKALALIWSVSNGDFFIRLTVLSVLLGHTYMWNLQLFMASVGFLWIFLVLRLNAWFVKSTVRQA